MNKNWKSCLIAMTALIAVATIHAQSSGTYTVHNLTVGGTATGSFGATSGTFQAAITDLKPTRSTVTNTNDTLNIAAGRCWGLAKSAATAKITAGNGNGTYVAYCTDSQTLVVEHATAAGLTVTCTNCTAAQVTTPAIPDGMVPIATGTLATGATVSAWSDPTDARDWHLGGQRHTEGAGLDVVCAGGVCTHAVDTAQVWVQGNTLAPVAGVDMTGATITKVFRETTSDPGTCSGTEVWRRTDTGALKHCVGGVATVIGGGGLVVYDLPFAAYQASGGTWSQQWSSANALTAGRTFGDDACPTTSSLRECGIRLTNLTDGSQMYLTRTIMLPSTWSGAITFRLVLASGYESFTPTIKVSTACMSNAAAPASYNSAQTITTGALTTGNTYVKSVALTTTGCTAGDAMTIQLTRDDTGSSNQRVILLGASVEVAL